MDLSVVDHWIGTCARDHKKCRENGESWYPSRLLRLGPQDREAKLIISKDSPPTGPYMTLSHRWGPHSYTKLKASTMVQLQSFIDVASLPQIFQDTIKIAGYLGINYLWIDALCILQDASHSELKNEIHNMHKIYSCALLNVSATMSLDGSECLFKERSWGRFLPSEIELEINGLFQKYYVLDGNIWYDEIANGPLNKRGWVFQERFLACRVLHFGEHQMGWECRELDALEMFPEGLPRAFVTSFISKSRVTSSMATLTPQSSDQTPDLEFVHQWQDLVIEYSKCELTYSTDKLIAFEGIARSTMNARTGHYAAGMWEKGMVYDLAWWRVSADREAFPIRKTSSRAPSWSWASVDGEINFPPTVGGVRAHFTDIMESTEPTTNESCAFATRESIRIKGHCIPLSIEYSNEEIVGFKAAGSRFHIGDGALSSSIDLEISEEELLDLAQRGKVLFLPLFATTFFLHGIVLEKIRGIRAHRRFGAVEIPILVKEMGQEGDHTSRPGQSELGAWRVMVSNPTNEFRSTAAVDLLRYLLKPQRVRRIIDIY